MNIQNVIDEFFSSYNKYELHPITEGNINTTFLLKIYIANNESKYILQKINKTVFKQPVEVINNATLILDYINNKSLFYLKTKNNLNYYIDDNGDYWRVYNYVKNSVSFSTTQNLNLIEQTGKAFGNFFYELSDFAPNQLNITIKDFHNTKKRFEYLESIINNNPARLKYANKECNLLLLLKSESLELQNMVDNSQLPIRVTHNDTKSNNVLFNTNTNEYITVIDFDTVMPGIIAHDFGDGARSICASLDENSDDFDSIYFDLNKFDSFAKGFLNECNHVLTQTEKESLYSGILTITTELSVRFLTDFLENDKYFKIDYPMHNLIRAKNQLTLAYDIYSKTKEIKNIINSYIK